MVVNRSESERCIFGDSDPWVRHLPLLWQGLAGDPHFVPPPDPVRGETLDAAAYWAPLLHMCWGRFGWEDPAAGIANWVALGCPTSEPDADFLLNWWGRSTEVMVLWAQRSQILHQTSQHIAAQLGLGIRDSHDDFVLQHSPSGDSVSVYQEFFTGGYDSLHLTMHVPGSLMMSSAKGARRIFRDPNHGSRDVALVLPVYAGWYRELAQLGADLGERADGRSWRVSVFVEPVGFLGTYRRSRVTGRWFAGRHRWHQVGRVSAGGG